MRQQLIDLNEIQKIDLGILEIVKRRDSIPARLQEFEATIGSTRAQLEELTTQRDQAQAEMKELETSVQGETDRVRKWERRLNDIRNQREYQALSREVDGSKRAVRHSEEQIMELMGKKEDLDSQIETLQDRLAEDEVDCDQERAAVDAQVADMDKEIAAQTERREALGPKIKTTLLRKYEAIRKKRVGVGLALASGGGCTVCNMRLPPQFYNILQRVDSIETCPNCQRIIVFEGVLENSGAEDDAEAAS